MPQGQRLGLQSPHAWGLPPHRGLAPSSRVCLRGAVVTQASPAQPSSLGDPRLLGKQYPSPKNLRVFVLVLGTPPQGEEEMMKGARWLVGTGTGCRELPLGAPSPQMKEMSGSSSARKGPEPGRARRTQQSPSRCHRPSSPGRVPGAAPCSESPLTSPSSQGEGASGERGDRCGDRHTDRQAGRSKCAGREQGEKAQHQERTLGLKD